MSIILEVNNLSKSFGGIHANRNISFEVKKGGNGIVLNAVK